MGDKLIHEYHDVDLDEVWRTVTTDMPHLIPEMKSLIPREESQ